MTSPLRILQRLGWKLTLSYTVVTVTAVLVLEAIAFLALILIVTRSPLINTLGEQLVTQLAQGSAPFLTDPPDLRGLRLYLSNAYPATSQGERVLQLSADGQEQQNSSGGLQLQLSESYLVAVVDTNGALLADNYPEDQPVGPPGETFVDSSYEAGSREVIELALRGDTTSRRLSDGSILSAAPVLNQNREIVAAVYLRIISISPVLSREFLLSFIQMLGVSALVITVAAAAIGTLFGFITARGLSRRLLRISHAADSWSQGDFSAFIRDSSQDELGELAGRLNRMAEQLQNLLHTRQELATMEERNRLARDLHDSVKQQVFATAMQVGAARALLTSDPRAAEQHLLEAEQLARQSQAELTSLIRELRPAALQGKGLAQAVQTFATDWSRQRKIPVQVGLQGERALPLEIEQALFRVVQEALANVARHSQATQVQLHIAWNPGDVVLTVEDNGQGFDPQEQSGKGLGLNSMRERIAALGGSLEVASRPGSGCKIKAVVKI